MTGTGNNVNAYQPKKIAAQVAAQKPVSTEVAIEKQPEVEVEEKKYQQYSSARVAVNVITDLGRKIKFSGHEYITDREDEKHIVAPIAIHVLHSAPNGRRRAA